MLWKSGDEMRMRMRLRSRAFTTKSEIWAYVIARCHIRYYLIIYIDDANANANANVDVDSDAIFGDC